MSDTLLIIPAYNEAECLGPLLAEVRAVPLSLDIVVVDDGSSDRTGEVARAGGAEVLSLACNLGVGGAVQTGFAYACARGYRYAVRCDADGQHTPSEIPSLLEPLKAGTADLVVGSRFKGSGDVGSTWVRTIGIRALSAFLTTICQAPVTDPTSGFQAANSMMMRFFADCYPAEYPEPEALALLRRQGYSFVEVPATFRPRSAGTSSISGWDTLYYAMKVFLALAIDRARPVDRALARHRQQERPV